MTAVIVRAVGDRVPAPAHVRPHIRDSRTRERDARGLALGILVVYFVEVRSRFAPLVLWLVVGCRQLLGLDDKPIEQLDAAAADARRDARPGDAAGYHAVAVRFD